MHVLLIEDDPETASHISRALDAEGHSLDVATTGPEGLEIALRNRADVLVVDRMLPGLGGLDVVRKMRSRGLNSPVLLLTALNSVSDRVEGLEAGADDYLAKPFAMAELQARLHALARRAPMSEKLANLVVGNLRLNRLHRKVTRDGTNIPLQPREYQLLEYLMANAGFVVTRTMLLREIWGFHFDPGTNIVETHICRLRAKIDRGGDPPLIDTVRGAGYVIRVE